MRDVRKNNGDDQYVAFIKGANPISMATMGSGYGPIVGRDIMRGYLDGGALSNVEDNALRSERLRYRANHSHRTLAFLAWGGITLTTGRIGQRSCESLQLP